eukprot:SM000001S04473  [mRNA]  locus=s1:387750:395011:+ [translate_table: standard]
MARAEREDDAEAAAGGATGAASSVGGGKKKGKKGRNAAQEDDDEAAMNALLAELGGAPERDAAPAPAANGAEDGDEPPGAATASAADDDEDGSLALAAALGGRKKKGKAGKKAARDADDEAEMDALLTELGGGGGTQPAAAVNGFGNDEEHKEADDGEAAGVPAAIAGGRKKKGKARKKSAREGLDDDYAEMDSLLAELGSVRPQPAEAAATATNGAHAGDGERREEDDDASIASSAGSKKKAKKKGKKSGHEPDNEDEDAVLAGRPASARAAVAAEDDEEPEAGPSDVESEDAMMAAALGGMRKAGKKGVKAVQGVEDEAEMDDVLPELEGRPEAAAVAPAEAAMDAAEPSTSNGVSGNDRQQEMAVAEVEEDADVPVLAFSGKKKKGKKGKKGPQDPEDEGETAELDNKPGAVLDAAERPAQEPVDEELLMAAMNGAAEGQRQESGATIATDADSEEVAITFEGKKKKGKKVKKEPREDAAEEDVLLAETDGLPKLAAAALADTASSSAIEGGSDPQEAGPSAADAVAGVDDTAVHSFDDKKKGKKGKKTGGAASLRALQDEDDIEALLAELDGPSNMAASSSQQTQASARLEVVAAAAAPVAADAALPEGVSMNEAAAAGGGAGADSAHSAAAAAGAKKGKKGKKGKQRTQEEEDEIDALLAELEGPPKAAPPAAPQARVVPVSDEGPPLASAAVESSVDGEGAVAEAAAVEGGDDDELQEPGALESAAAKKKRKKKEKEKAAKAAAAEKKETEAGDAAPAAEAATVVAAATTAGKGKAGGADKKLPKHVREMQERLARLKEAEEKRRAEEEERGRKEEEEEARLAELERQKEEAKKRRKEREKEKLLQKKKEGLLLTGKQKEEAKRLAAMRQQLLAQAGLDADKEVDAAEPPTPGAQKKKVIYESRKKRRPSAQTLADEFQHAGDLVDHKLGEVVDAEPAESAAEQAIEDHQEDDEEYQEEDSVQQAEAVVQEDAEPPAAVLEEEEEEEEEEEKEEEEDEWDAKSWDADDVALPALKKRGAFDEDEEESEEERVAAATRMSSKPMARAEPAKKTLVKQASTSREAPIKARGPAKQPQRQAAESESENDSEDDEEDESDVTSDSGTDSEDDNATVRKKREARQRREARKAEALSQRSAEDLRSPICCILGHVDTGKTKLLDCIRRTNVQEGEAGGITQQIGATYFPMENIRERTKELKADATLRVPGLLIIDTPGHESFTNLRARGSSLCDIAILVVDIMHGLEPQTIESLNLLKSKKTPFIVAMNKVDRLYSWKSMLNAPIRTCLKQQNRDIITQLKEQGLNSSLYYKNPDIRKYLSIVPTSAISGEGIPDILLLLVQLTQKMMEEKLMFITEVQCTVLEVKVVEGLGTTIDVVLVNGILHEGDQIVVPGLQGPIVTTIRALLTPHPMKELRIKGSYLHHKELKAAQGIKLTAQGLEHAIAGTQLYVVGPDDDVEDIKEEAMQDIGTVLSQVDKSGEGVCVQASTLGSLEALLEFLKSPDVKIPVSGISIGPVHKKDVMRASVMLERKRKEYAVILAFDVKVTTEAREMAEEVGVRIFIADIIYHLFDQFTAYMANLREERRREKAEEAVFPCVLKILPNCIFNKKDPIVLGVEVVDGIAKIGTPICVPSKGFIDIGKIASIEINHKVVDMAKKGQAVAMKILGTNAEEVQKMFGRHFEQEDELVSHITRNSIDVLKENYRNDLSKDDWVLVVKLKKLYEIP